MEKTEINMCFEDFRHYLEHLRQDDNMNPVLMLAYLDDAALRLGIPPFTADLMRISRPAASHDPKFRRFSMLIKADQASDFATHVDAFFNQPSSDSVSG